MEFKKHHEEKNLLNKKTVLTPLSHELGVPFPTVENSTPEGRRYLQLLKNRRCVFGSFSNPRAPAQGTITFTCPAGHVCTVTSHSFRNSTLGCISCKSLSQTGRKRGPYKLNPYTETIQLQVNHLKQLAAEKNHQILSLSDPKFPNNGTLTLRCLKHGVEWEVTVKSYRKTKNGCPSCRSFLVAENNRQRAALKRGEVVTPTQAAPPQTSFPKGEKKPKHPHVKSKRPWEGPEILFKKAQARLLGQKAEEQQKVAENLNLQKRVTALLELDWTWDAISENVGRPSALIRRLVPLNKKLGNPQVYALNETTIRRQYGVLYYWGIKTPCCQACGLSKWHGQSIFHVTEIDHMDGNSKNNRPQNLRVLCGNCHTQRTTRKKNKDLITNQNLDPKVSNLFNTLSDFEKTGSYDSRAKTQGVKPTLRTASNKTPLKDILAGKYPAFQAQRLGDRLIGELVKEPWCESCGPATKLWRGLPIRWFLDVHHINGVGSDHCLSNLALLCKNCHLLAHRAVKNAKHDTSN
jgi:5-methylcytosine-specific restriction endonuclease McrA